MRLWPLSSRHEGVMAQGVNPSWLAELAPEHAPPPPGWWPPAPGWWVLAGLILALVVVAILWWRKPRRRLQRATLRELARIRATARGPAETARAIQNLLRRYALACFGAEPVARLNGTAWLSFLAERGGAAFRGPVGQSLLAASYGAEPAAGLASAQGTAGDADGWFSAAEEFIRRAARKSPGRRAS
jgi:hypothetical protein